MGKLILLPLLEGPVEGHASLRYGKKKAQHLQDLKFQTNDLDHSTTVL